MNNIQPVQNTNNIRFADFVRLTTPDAVYRFATTASPLTVSAVDSEPFDALGSLVKVGDATRDIKSTANETSFTLVGIDTAMLGLVLSNQAEQYIKSNLLHEFYEQLEEDDDLMGDRKWACMSDLKEITDAFNIFYKLMPHEDEYIS